jgi:hypothetical protein
MVRLTATAMAIGTVLACAWTPAADAGQVYFRLSGGAPVSDPCLARTYDDNHLRRNPRQTVTHFHLRRQRQTGPGENAAERFTVRIGFNLKGDRDAYSVNGICTTNGAAADCLGEGDTGAFRLELRGDDVRVSVERLEVEGPRRSSPDLAASDDRVFLLRPAPFSACR